jgi:hypothetical protein
MQLGEAVTVRMSKWGGRPHWEYAAVWLGSDDVGDWVGTPAGTHHHRPGAEFWSQVDTVTLLPREQWWAATFHRPGMWCATYVDMATPTVWEGTVATAVDLDLDVVLPSGGEWYVDDEDEFAEHQVAYGYPGDVIAATERSRDQVWAAATSGTGVFDGRDQAWLEQLTVLTGTG